MSILASNRKRRWMGLVWLLLVLPTAAFAQTSVVVQADILNVRSEPWGKRIGRVYSGQQFIVEKHQGAWGCITYQADCDGWISLDYTRQYVPRAPSISKQQYCSELNAEFDRLGWTEIRCRPGDWKVGGASVQGRPLLYDEFKGPGQRFQVNAK